MSRGDRDKALRPYSRLSGPEPLLVLPNSFSVVLTRLSGPRSRPTTSQKVWWRRESKPDLWICSQELWPLDNRGGRYICIIYILYIYYATKSNVLTSGSPVANPKSGPPLFSVYYKIFFQNFTYSVKCLRVLSGVRLPQLEDGCLRYTDNCCKVEWHFNFLNKLRTKSSGRVCLTEPAVGSESSVDTQTDTQTLLRPKVGKR
jgi:hypothetical protein